MGNSVSRTPKPAMGGWQDPGTLLLVREVRAVRPPRSCLCGLRVFAGNCTVEIRVEQTPRPGQGQDVDSSGHTLVMLCTTSSLKGKVLPSAWHLLIHSGPHLSILHSSIHPSMYLPTHPSPIQPPIHPSNRQITHPLVLFLHSAFIVWLTLCQGRHEAVAEMDTAPLPVSTAAEWQNWRQNQLPGSWL